MPKFIFTILLILFLLPLSVQAQTTDELFNTSIQSGTLYRTSHSAYLQAKNQYLQYNTGATRTAAIEKTTNVLASRNTWQINYLRFLRQTLADATNIANYPQTVTYLDLETEINNLSNLKYNSSELDSFTKINTASANWESRLEKTNKLVATVKLQITSARLANLQSQLKSEFQTFESRIGTPSATTKSTLTLISQKLDDSISLREKIDNSLSGRQDSQGYRQSLQKVLTDLTDASRLLLELGYQIP